MKNLSHQLYLLILLALFLSGIVQADTVYDGQAGRVTQKIDSTGLLQIDDTTYRLTHRTKVGFMISPTSITPISRHDFPLEMGTSVYFNAEPSVDGNPYQNLEFIFRSID